MPCMITGASDGIAAAWFAIEQRAARRGGCARALPTRRGTSACRSGRSMRRASARMCSLRPHASTSPRRIAAPRLEVERSGAARDEREPGTSSTARRRRGVERSSLGAGRRRCDGRGGGRRRAELTSPTGRRSGTSGTRRGHRRSLSQDRCQACTAPVTTQRSAPEAARPSRRAGRPPRVRRRPTARAARRRARAPTSDEREVARAWRRPSRPRGTGSRRRR